MSKLRQFFSRNSRIFFWILFLFFYAAGISYAVPPTTYYQAGETLDPGCVPGSTKCTVLLIPDQTSNSGKFLTTNGSEVSWATGASGVTSVSGTTNRITSTGGTTPVIDISASYVGQSSITTLGTITTGVWNGTAITAARGGTGLTSLTAYALLAGGTTSTGNFQQVSGVGTSGQVLKSNGAGLLPSWQADTNTNIYNTDGTVAGNRTVTLGSNSLTMTGVGQFSGTPTLFNINPSAKTTFIGADNNFNATSSLTFNADVFGGPGFNLYTQYSHTAYVAGDALSGILTLALDANTIQFISGGININNGQGNFDLGNHGVSLASSSGTARATANFADNSDGSVGQLYFTAVAGSNNATFFMTAVPSPNANGSAYYTLNGETTYMNTKLRVTPPNSLAFGTPAGLFDVIGADGTSHFLTIDQSTGNTSLSTLAGSGNRCVEADSSGVLTPAASDCASVGGGSDGNGIYDGSGTLPGNTTVDMDSNTLTFQNGNFALGDLAGNGDGVVGIDDDGNLSWSNGNTIYTSDGSLTGNRQIDLNGNVLQVRRGLDDFLQINPVTFTSYIQATDGTAFAGFSGDGNLSGSFVQFRALADDGTNPTVSIVGNAIDQTIALTAASGITIWGDLIVVGSATTCDIGDGVGATLCSSDERLKKDIEPLADSLEQIMQLRPVTFTWKDPNKAQDTKIGFIAQEVQQVFPQFVGEVGNTGTLGIDYAALITPTIKAVQELGLRINDIDNIPGTDEGASFIDKLIAWFANAGNGIEEFVAGTLRARKDVCVGDTCITEAQLQALMMNAGLINQDNNDSNNNQDTLPENGTTDTDSTPPDQTPPDSETPPPENIVDSPVPPPEGDSIDDNSAETPLSEPSAESSE